MSQGLSLWYTCRQISQYDDSHFLHLSLSLALSKSSPQSGLNSLMLTCCRTCYLGSSPFRSCRGNRETVIIPSRVGLSWRLSQSDTMDSHIRDIWWCSCHYADSLSSNPSCSRGRRHVHTLLRSSAHWACSRYYTESLVAPFFLPLQSYPLPALLVSPTCSSPAGLL